MVKTGCGREGVFRVYNSTSLSRANLDRQNVTFVIMFHKLRNWVHANKSSSAMSLHVTATKNLFYSTCRSVAEAANVQNKNFRAWTKKDSNANWRILYSLNLSVFDG
jgi:hypothetical protein